MIVYSRFAPHSKTSFKTVKVTVTHTYNKLRHQSVILNHRRGISTPSQSWYHFVCPWRMKGLVGLRLGRTTGTRTRYFRITSLSINAPIVSSIRHTYKHSDLKSFLRRRHLTGLCRADDLTLSATL